MEVDALYAWAAAVLEAPVSPQLAGPAATRLFRAALPDVPIDDDCDVPRATAAVLDYFEHQLRMWSDGLAAARRACSAGRSDGDGDERGWAPDETAATLLRLLLAAAVQGAAKDDHVAVILRLPEATQAALMAEVQGVMDSLHSTDGSSGAAEGFEATPAGGAAAGDATQRAPGGGSAARAPADADDGSGASRRELEQRLHAANQELVELRARLQAATAAGAGDARAGMDSSSGATRGPVTAAAAGQIQLLEAHVRDLEALLREREAALAELRETTSSERRDMEALTRAQADELDVLRTRAAGMRRLEQQLAKARERLEDAQELRARVRALEAANDEHMQRALDLESQLAQAAAARDAVQSYRDRLHEADAQLTEARAAVTAKERELGRVRADRDDLAARVRVLEEAVRAADGRQVQDADGADGLDEFMDRRQLERELSETRSRCDELSRLLAAARAAPSTADAAAGALVEVQAQASPSELAEAQAALQEARQAAAQEAAGRAADAELIQRLQQRVRDGDNRAQAMELQLQEAEARASAVLRLEQLLRQKDEQLREHQRRLRDVDAERAQRDRDAASRREALLTSALWEVGRDIQRQLLRRAMTAGGDVAATLNPAETAAPGTRAAVSWLHQQRLFAAARRTPVVPL